MARVRIKIEHPEFKADCVVEENKSIEYLEDIRETLHNNISVTTEVVDDDVELSFDISGPLPTKKKLKGLAHIEDIINNQFKKK